jgi:pimeloyl-ACP methyl ester carboxylesterase
VVEVRVVEVAGTRIGYRSVGDAASPVAVLLHGGGSDASTWDRFAAVLAGAGWRTVAVDLPGHGRSGRLRTYTLAGYRDAVAGLLDALALDRPALVGHSLGAHTASLVAMDRPVNRLVLEDPPAPSPGGEPAAGLSPARMAVLFAGSLLRRGRYHPRALTSAIRELRRPDPGWWQRLATITAPALVISGGPASHLAPRRTARVADALPDGRLVTIPVGHRVHSLAPEPFRDAVLPFMTLTDR